MRNVFWLLLALLCVPGVLRADELPYVLAARAEGSLKAYERGSDVTLVLACTGHAAASFSCEWDGEMGAYGTKAWCGTTEMTATIQHTTIGSCQNVTFLTSTKTISLQGSLIRAGDVVAVQKFKEISPRRWVNYLRQKISQLSP